MRTFIAILLISITEILMLHFNIKSATFSGESAYSLFLLVSTLLCLFQDIAEIIRS